MSDNSASHFEELANAGRKDRETVTPDGQECRKLIDGVRLRDLVLHTDERGEVCEMYDPRWGFNPDPMVFSYFYTIRPGWAKGWAYHKVHEDRYCLLKGEMKVVLYDPRPDSPTYGMINEICLSEHRRRLLSIPRLVWHADENLGTGDVLVVNFPTIQYDHSSPDKYRLPLDTDLIPYKFHPSIRF
ncbi:MAG: dTDP-4-dehydrorhamnose 3,5-epimerase family protein [Verrucomicrobiota bacterium]